MTKPSTGNSLSATLGTRQIGVAGFAALASFAVIAVAALFVSGANAVIDESDGRDPATVTVHPGNIVGGSTAGNQATCQDHGFDWGLSTGGNDSRTYSTTSPLAVSIDVRFNANRSVDFESTVPVGGVAIKGGNGYTFYDYTDPATQLEDDGLITGQGQSHAVFCFDLPLTVTKTVNVNYERHIDWTIDKSASPASWNLFVGDSATSVWTVKATKTVTIKNVTVSGSITVANNTGLASPASVSAVNDTVTIGGVARAATVTCPALPATLASGASLTCSYSVSLPDSTDLTLIGSNTASAIVADGGVGLPNNGTVTMPVDLNTAVATSMGEPETITVTDSNGSSWTDIGKTTEWSYPQTFTCPGKVHTNTATITETGDTASATVTIRCYEISVAKTADTSWKRTWDWSVAKSVDQPSLTLSAGQTHTVNYTVTVTPTKAESDYTASGTITVTNPAPMAATLTGVTDVISGPVNANVTCPALSVPANGSLTCTYTAALPDATPRTNTATATQQHYAYGSNGVGVATGTSDHSGQANVIFSATPTTEIDESATLADSLVSSVNQTFNAADGAKTVKYSYDIMFPVCGDYTVNNTATLTSNDTSTKDAASAVVTVKIPCATGCTLTQGYWKTHSDRGPAPYDDAWKNIGPLEEDTPFFSSGMTWYQVFWTPPQGNVYYQLAHQYMAAKLNVLNGASTTAAVDSALASAEAFFAARTPSTTLTRAQRSAAVATAGTLGSYNEGLIGPGHCSE